MGSANFYQSPRTGLAMRSPHWPASSRPTMRRSPPGSKRPSQLSSESRRPSRALLKQDPPPQPPSLRGGGRRVSKDQRRCSIPQATLSHPPCREGAGGGGLRTQGGGLLSPPAHKKLHAQHWSVRQVLKVPDQPHHPLTLLRLYHPRLALKRWCESRPRVSTDSWDWRVSLWFRPAGCRHSLRRYSS